MSYLQKAGLSGLRLLGGFEHAQDVALLHDQEVFTFELHLGAGPFAEQDAVADLDVERLQLAGIVTRAGADGEDFAFLRLFLRGVGDDDPALGLFLLLDAADEDAIAERTKRHVGYLRRAWFRFRVLHPCKAGR